MKNIIGENLYAARQYLDLTIKQVADILGVSASEIDNYETGRSTPDSQMIINFSKLYGVACLDLLTEHDFSKSKDKQAVAALIKFKNELKK